MKRMIIILAIILFAAPVFGEWPENYQGEEQADGCHEIVANIFDYHDRNPWGMPDPSYTFNVLGTVCFDNGVATLTFNNIAYIKCVITPYSGPDANCKAKLGPAWSEGPKVLPFVDGSYIAGVWEHKDGEQLFVYEALTCTSEECVLVDGVFEFVTPFWYYEHDGFTRARWEIHPWNGEIIEKSQRRAGARR